MRPTQMVSLIVLLILLGVGVYWVYDSDQSDLDQPQTVATIDNGMRAHTFGKELFLDAKTEEFNNLAALQAGSEEIVVATKIDQRAPTVNYVADGQISIAYTLSDFRVNRALKGEALKVGRDFVILENEAYDASRDLTYHIGNYVLMDKGAQYLLFLRHSTTSTYYLVQGVNAGKVALTPSGSQHLVMVMAQVAKRETVESREILAQFAAEKVIQSAALTQYWAEIAEGRE